jgi:hypothetical protein
LRAATILADGTLSSFIRDETQFSQSDGRDIKRAEEWRSSAVRGLAGVIKAFNFSAT